MNESGTGGGMKVLFVHQYLGAFGGAEANIELTAGELHRRGHSLALLYRHATNRSETAWREIFTECFQLPTDGHIELVEGVLDHFAPDIIYLHNLADLPVLEALLQGQAPVVRMVHDHALYCLRGYKYNPLTRNICTRPASAYCVFPCLAPLARNRGGGFPLRWASFSEKQKEIRLNQQCARLVVFSQYMKDELVRNGFDAERIELCAPVRPRPDDGLVSSFSERNLVLFAGQLLRGKGVDILLRALVKVRVPFECLILGDGHHRAYCERLCRQLGLGQRVRFQGFVLPARLKEFYLQASVFVMSSLWPEPFGLAGPEAMRYGVPVVAFDAGAIREWLRDGQNGWLVPWKDTDRMAARIEELLQNKELARRLGRGALEWVKRYDAARQIDGLEALFQRVLHQGRPQATDPYSSAGNLSAYD